MSYMVIFRTAEGKPGYQQAEGTQQAVEAVEHLRNQEGVENVRIFRMEEVAFEYKVHYKVELAEEPISGGPASASSALSWDDDRDGLDDVVGAPDPTEAVPATDLFDQQAAIDHTEEPRWDGATEPVADDESTTAARRGLFGR